MRPKQVGIRLAHFGLALPAPLYGNVSGIGESMPLLRDKRRHGPGGRP